MFRNNFQWRKIDEKLITSIKNKPSHLPLFLQWLLDRVILCNMRALCQKLKNPVITWITRTVLAHIYKYALEIMEVIGTEGALKRPMTYDNHHIHPSIPTPHIALKTTSHELR